ncbi:down syndrome cell adhesion molecule-like protein Dscam2 [Trichonephila clavipes]|uniref:Down syndrome cell adhesion molecule-like protein Dscam2 n=1 Tax=Trichonephila clavipes TaxID=2585209 RepID=A0A8X6W9V5_TRICX|nr:down syndrome cell adhesion molecule-like protein Dscam2 [Trichonephila clavipes]
MVGVSFTFCALGYGFDPGPSRWIFMIQKIDSGHVKVDSDDIQELLDSNNLELTIDELIRVEMHEWYKKDGVRLVPVNARPGVILLSGSLYFQQVNVRDSGTYVCVVNNSAGEKRMESSLTVTEDESRQGALQKLNIKKNTSSTGVLYWFCRLL